jgi:hypothetical protein
MDLVLSLAAAWLCMLSVFAVQPASAQLWRNHEFHTEPWSLGVNDHIPHPMLYYYSDEQGNIYTTRSNNNDVFISSTFPMGRVTCYSFITSSRGWACGDNGLLSSTDSGYTWQPVEAMCSPGSKWTQVYYSKFSRTLFALSAVNGLWASSDEGATWSQVLDGGFGGMVCHADQGVLLSSNNGLSYYTTDAGRTWDTSHAEITTGKPFYYTSDSKFLAASILDSSLYSSKDGDEWKFVRKLDQHLLGDVFSDCDHVFVPAHNAKTYGFFDGTLDSSMRYFAAQTLVTHPVYCYSSNTLYFFYRRPDKPEKLFMGNLYSRFKLDLEVTGEQYFYIPRCSTLTKTIRIGISPMKTGDANHTIRELQSSPFITMLSSPIGVKRDFIEIKLQLTGDLKPQKATFLVEAERCGITSTQFTIYTAPTSNATTLQADNISFGYLGTCNEDERWLHVYNPDCDSMALTALSLKAPNANFLILPGQLPRMMAPNSGDSVLVRFTPAAVGGQSAVIDIKYRTFDGDRSTTAYVSGTSVSGAAATSLRDTVDFGNITNCAKALSRTSIQNTGCEEMTIEDLRLPAGSKFIIRSSVVGKVLKQDSVIDIDLEASTLVTGSYHEDLEVIARSVNGTRITLQVKLLSNVTTGVTDYTLTDIGHLTGLTTCNYIDTAVTIKNLSTCEPLRIMNVEVSHPAVRLRDDFTPITLQQGESATFHLRLAGSEQTEISDKLIITTDLFGTLSRDIYADVSRPRLSTFNVVMPAGDYHTTQCQPVTKHYSFSTAGCGYLPLGEVRLEAPGATRFVLQLSGGLPSELIEGQSIGFDVTYDPDLVGADNAAIVIEGGENSILARLPLAGSISNTKRTIGLSMSLDRTTPIRTEEQLEVTLRATDDLDPAMRLHSIRTDLQFDHDLFELISLEAATDIDVSSTAGPDGETFTLTSASAMSFAKNDVIARMKLQPFVTDKTSTPITLSGLVLNDNDPEYLRCVLAPASTLSTSTAEVLLDCSERIVSNSMRKAQTMEIVGVYPQPAESGQEWRIEMRLKQSVLLHLRITDALGREELNFEQTFLSGAAVFHLPALRSGYHNLIIRTSHSTHTVPLIVR